MCNTARSKISRFRSVIAAFSALSFAVATCPLAAKEREQATVLNELIDCRKLDDNSMRLACYDRNVDLVKEASARDDLVVLDRATVQKTRRSLFGLSLPKLSIFGDDDDRDEKNRKIKEVEATIDHARGLKDGEWLITLDDGARWQTLEPMFFGEPRSGLKIVIRRLAFESYKASIDKGPATRIKRVN